MQFYEDVGTGGDFDFNLMAMMGIVQAFGRVMASPEEAANHFVTPTTGLVTILNPCLGRAFSIDSRDYMNPRRTSLPLAGSNSPACVAARVNLPIDF